VGLPRAEAEALPRETYADAVGGLPKSKVHCSVLAASAVRQAIAGWREAQA
jgi:NifU-like protein involved in Fe-S cluster formation